MSILSNKDRLTKNRFVLRSNGSGLNDEIIDSETAVEMMEQQFILSKLRELDEAINEAKEKYFKSPLGSNAESDAVEKWINLASAKELIEKIHPKIA